MSNIKTSGNNKNYWWLPLLSGVIFTIFGLWFLMIPLDSFATFTTIFGFIILISGISEIYFAIVNRKIILDFQSFLWGGIFNLILGFILILNPGIIIVAISIMISFWLILKGGELVKKATDLKKSGDKSWSRPMFFGILLFVIALILIWHPQIIGITIALWTSFAFISLGIFRIYLAFRIRKS